MDRNINERLELALRPAERFGALGERHERWRVDESLIDGVLKGERPYVAFLNLAGSRRDLPPPLVELRRSLARVKDEAERDAAVVAALVLYKTPVKNAETYREWAEVYRWARGLVERQEFTVKAEEVRRLREAHRRLEEVAEEVRRELNRVLVLYLQSDFYKERPDLLNKLKQLLEVDLGEAEELAEARGDELSEFGGVNIGTKAYAALLSIARGGIYGHAAILLMMEGALADIMLLTPMSAYDKAWEIAKGRGESVDPSRSLKGAVDWEDRAASVLLRFLIGYGEADLKFRRVEKGGKKDDEKDGMKGFQVFRSYGGVEAFVGELWIGKTAYFKVSKEELRRRVEEAKRTAPDLSGLDKAPQYLEWRATDVTTSGKRIMAGTVHPWQLKWYFGLLGEEKSFRGWANVTKEGIKLSVDALWPRKRENQILGESRWLKSLLGHSVNNWRELVDAINWSWVLEKVEKLAEVLKPWIGPEKMGDAEREELARRMLGELALLAHFAEARRGKDDGEWRKERAKKLTGAVEALSGGRIAGKHADRLARAIILYAEGRKKRAERRIKSLAKEVGVSREEVWGVVRRVLSGEDLYAYCLARDCARDEVVRKFVAPALELIMLDKALRGEFDREEALLRFGEMYATAVAGDGTVASSMVVLTVGGELGGGAALLRLATLHLLNELLPAALLRQAKLLKLEQPRPDELKFNARIYVGEGRYYRIAAYGENAARFMRLLAVSAPSTGGEYLSEKFNEFVKAAKVEVRLNKDNIRRTKKGCVAADLTLSETGVAVKYNVYLRNEIVLQSQSSDRSRVELAAILLRHAGVSAEVKKREERNMWYVRVTTDKLAAGREELRKAIAEIVKEAVARGWIDANKAERWLEKLEKGLTLKEGSPKYLMRLTHSGALVVRFSSTDRNSIEWEAQRFRDMGLVEGVHFSVKMPEEGREGYVSVLKEGLSYAAWLSVYGSERQRELAAEFVSYILQRAWEAGENVHEKAKKIIEEGMSRASLTLKGFEKEVEVDGTKHKVKVIDGEAVKEKQNGKTLLRIRITAEVDGVRRDYMITYSRRGADNVAKGSATARADAPGGRETDAERFSALVEALTGVRPRIRRRSDGKIEIECGRAHLDGFMRFAELADAIARWLEETGR